MNEKRFFIYARKSTDDASRQVRSIDDQIAEVKELAARENLQIVEVLKERQTAKVPGRPVFNQMLERIKAGEACGIIAWHPDRLARNSYDSGQVMDLIDKGIICYLRFCTFLFESNAQGKFMLAIMFGQSKYYSDSLSENILRGKRQKLKDGIWPQLAPIGYLNDRNTRGIVPDPVRGPLVRKAFELYAAGDCTLDHLTSTMNNLGLKASPYRRKKKKRNKPLSRTQFHRLLCNPIYYGPFRYNGELHEGTHEPLISKALFDRVQEIVRKKRKAHTKILKPYLYRKVFRCGECGGMITIETQKGHNYLRCTKKKGACSQGYLREEEISRQINVALPPLAIPSPWITSMAAEIQHEAMRHSRTRNGQRRDLDRKLLEADQKSERLTEAYMAVDKVLTSMNSVVPRPSWSKKRPP
jgi:site-specific DNA recombinase